MGAVKNYYHDEICQREDDPQADQPNPAEEAWWSEQDNDTTWIAEQEGDYMPEDNGEGRCQ